MAVKSIDLVKGRRWVRTACPCLATPGHAGEVDGVDAVRNVNRRQGGGKGAVEEVHRVILHGWHGEHEDGVVDREVVVQPAEGSRQGVQGQGSGVRARAHSQGSGSGSRPGYRARVQGTGPGFRVQGQGTGPGLKARVQGQGSGPEVGMLGSSRGTGFQVRAAG